MSMTNIAHVAHMSGGILYLMAVLLLVALAVTFERFWVLSRMLGHGKAWTRELKTRKHLDRRAVEEMISRDPDSPFAQVAGVALSHDVRDPLDHFSAQLDEAVMDNAPRTDRGLWVLDTIVTLAPLLGLLGTIIGMFNTFNALSNPGAQTQAVTGGVGEALIATAAGLFIAVLGLVAFNALHQRVRLVMHQLERIKIILLNRMYPHVRDGAAIVSERPAAEASRHVAPAAHPSATQAHVLQQKVA